MPTSQSIDWRRRAWEALSRTEIMVLATVDPDSGAWTSSAQFSTPGATQQEDGLVLTFLSRPGTRHGANIDRDPRVAVSIYSWPGPDGGNLGPADRRPRHRGRPGLRRLAALHDPTHRGLVLRLTRRPPQAPGNPQR